LYQCGGVLGLKEAIYIAEQMKVFGVVFPDVATVWSRDFTFVNVVSTKVA
jgi:hypothetical protein